MLRIPDVAALVPAHAPDTLGGWNRHVIINFHSTSTLPRLLTPAPKDFRICVCETAAGLAEQVNELLAQGWELHGHPFVELQFPRDSNGHGPTGNRFCQALVKPQPPSAVYAPSAPQPRPARPRIPLTFRNVAAFLAVLAAGALLADGLIFRSGYYGHFIEPESSTGSFERTFKTERDRASTHLKEILLVGSSRMAEGFSARLANLNRPEDGYRFFNCAVPSAGPRAFYYLLRDLDPHRNRYAAIYLPIDDYDDPDDLEDLADRASELRLVINRLRFTDIVPFTFSFTTGKVRREVFRGSLLKGTVFQLDLADFLERPTERLNRVKMFRESGANWAYDYNGIEHSLAGLSVDWANHAITFPPGMPADQQQFYRDMFFRVRPQQGRVRAFEVRWLSAVAGLYRNSKTRIVLFEAPRSPAPHAATVHLPWTAVDVLSKLPGVTVVDRHKFEPLERAELFADYVHLNTEGRKLFTAAFVDSVKELIH